MYQWVKAPANINSNLRQSFCIAFSNATQQDSWLCISSPATLHRSLHSSFWITIGCPLCASCYPPKIWGILLMGLLAFS